jgi:hypothetical protein
MSVGSVLGRGKNFSLLHNVQTASGAHAALDAVITGGGGGGCFQGGKAARA